MAGNTHNVADGPIPGPENVTESPRTWAQAPKTHDTREKTPSRPVQAFDGKR